jgi:hypothetical protein
MPSYNPELDRESFEQACLNAWAIWKAGYLTEGEYARNLVAINRRYFETGDPLRLPERRPLFTPRGIIRSDPLFDRFEAAGMTVEPNALPVPENPVTGQTTGGLNEMG